jgi:hypothetical protein
MKGGVICQITKILLLHCCEDVILILAVLPIRARTAPAAVVSCGAVHR